MKRLTTFIAGAAVAAILGGCQQPAVSGWKSFSGDKNIERRVDSVLSLMTLEEKVGQMAQYSCNWDVTGPVMTGDYETLLKQGLVGSLFNVYTVDGVRKMQEMALSESCGIWCYDPRISRKRKCFCMSVSPREEFKNRACDS